MYQHQDALQALDANIPLAGKLAFIHAKLRESYDFIDRIAIALYEYQTDVLKTYLHSSGGAAPLDHYHTKLEEAPSLQDIVQRRMPRVVNDLAIFGGSTRKHAVNIARQGYGASYTWPMYYGGAFFGFIFVNSYRKDCFTPHILSNIDPILRVLALATVAELNSVNTLTAALRTTCEITRQRDPETGAHLERMARYSQLIARELAPAQGFSDEFVELLFLFAPLHDVGKVAIPDQILLKRGTLTQEEFEVMKTHALRGRDIIDQMLKNFAMDRSPHIGLLRNIIAYHHEAVNGTGYPDGRSGEDIPIEARITAVADVFDALTSVRPYKEAWDNERAFAMLREISGEKLDRDCVDALLGHREEIEEIQKSFREDALG